MVPDAQGGAGMPVVLAMWAHDGDGCMVSGVMWLCEWYLQCEYYSSVSDASVSTQHVMAMWK